MAEASRLHLAESAPEIRVKDLVELGSPDRKQKTERPGCQRQFVKPFQRRKTHKIQPPSSHHPRRGQRRLPKWRGNVA